MTHPAMMFLLQYALDHLPFSLGSMLGKNLQLVTEILEVRFSPFDGSLAAVETDCSEL